MDITEKIKSGMKKEASDVVSAGNTAAVVKSGLLDVYATPAMTALMEQAAAELIQELFARRMDICGNINVDRSYQCIAYRVENTGRSKDNGGRRTQNFL